MGPPAQTVYYGLKNQGATCYLNSVLQALFMTKDFREAVERSNCANDRPLKDLFTALKKHTSHTRDITRSLGIDRVYEQCDAAEHYEKILRLISPEASQIFKPLLTDKNKCAECGTETDTDAPFWSLPLALGDSNGRDHFSVVDGIKNFFSVSHMRGDNQIYCDVCEAKTDTTIQFVIKHHPEVMTLLLKRFKFDFYRMEHVKTNCSVDIPYTIQMPENQKYELYAFVEHFGGLKSGHYTATAKSQDDNTGKWYNFNDAYVSTLNEKPSKVPKDISKSAYLLFYRKMNAHAADTTQDNSEVSTSDCQDDREMYVKHNGMEHEDSQEEKKTKRDKNSRKRKKQKHGVEKDRNSVTKEEQTAEKLSSGEVEKPESHSVESKEEEDEPVKQKMKASEEHDQDNKGDGYVQQSKPNDWERKENNDELGSNYPGQTSEESSVPSVEEMEKEETKRDNESTQQRQMSKRHGDTGSDQGNRKINVSENTLKDDLEQEVRGQEVCVKKQSKEPEMITDNQGVHMETSVSRPAQTVYYGLKNQGATCYLNSVLQALFMTKDFREAVERSNCANDRPLKDLFTALKKHTSHTRDITRSLGIDRVYEQCDAAEHYEKILRLISPEASQIFKPLLTDKNKCAECGTETDTDAPFWSLPLALEDSNGRDHFSVVDGIKNFFSVSHMRGDNQIYCDVCEAKTDTTIQLVIKHHPEVMTLLLKRFKFDFYRMEHVKTNCSVDIPYTIQMPENQKYELYAFVEHFGGLKSGHYTATAKSQDDNTGKWYNFNDAYVSKLNEKPSKVPKDISRSAYLLFYRKMNAHAADTTQDNSEVSTSDCQDDREMYVKHNDMEHEDSQEEKKTKRDKNSRKRKKQKHGVEKDRNSVTKEEQTAEKLSSGEVEKPESHSVESKEEEDEPVKQKMKASEEHDQGNKGDGYVQQSKPNDWERKENNDELGSNYPGQTSEESSVPSVEEMEKEETKRDNESTQPRQMSKRHGDTGSDQGNRKINVSENTLKDDLEQEVRGQEVCVKKQSKEPEMITDNQGVLMFKIQRSTGNREPRQNDQDGIRQETKLDEKSEACRIKEDDEAVVIHSEKETQSTHRGKKDSITTKSTPNEGKEHGQGNKGDDNIQQNKPNDWEDKKEINNELGSNYPGQTSVETERTEKGEVKRGDKSTQQREISKIPSDTGSDDQDNRKLNVSENRLKDDMKQGARGQEVCVEKPEMITDNQGVLMFKMQRSTGSREPRQNDQDGIKQETKLDEKSGKCSVREDDEAGDIHSEKETEDEGKTRKRGEKEKKAKKNNCGFFIWLTRIFRRRRKKLSSSVDAQ